LVGLKKSQMQNTLRKTGGFDIERMCRRQNIMPCVYVWYRNIMKRHLQDIQYNWKQFSPGKDGICGSRSS
jgi:hypothetical protein